MDELIATVQLFAFGWEPEGWFKCDGRSLQVQQYPALFSLLGIQYGGDGVKTFNLPKMTSPDPHMNYCICWNGIYPVRP